MSYNNILIPTGMDSTTGQFKISGLNDILKTPAQINNSGTPTLTMQSALGTSGNTATIVGTNTAGVITLKTGLLSLGIGKILTFTFADGFAWPNACVVVFSPSDANFATAYTKIYSPIGTSTSVDVFVSAALSIATTYTGSYKIEGW